MQSCVLFICFSLFSFYRQKISKETNKKKKEKREKRFIICFITQQQQKWNKKFLLSFSPPNNQKTPPPHITHTLDHARSYLDTHKQREDDIWLNFVTPVPFWNNNNNNNNHSSFTRNIKENRKEKEKCKSWILFCLKRKQANTH